MGLFIVVILGIALHTLRQPPEPIQLIGELSPRDVAEIRVALRHKTHPPLLPKWSLASLRAAPGLLADRFTKPDAPICRIEMRNREFAAVITRLPTNSVGDKYVFWCAFKETNKWWVGDPYSLADYNFDSNAPGK